MTNVKLRILEEIYNKYTNNKKYQTTKPSKSIIQLKKDGLVKEFVSKIHKQTKSGLTIHEFTITKKGIDVLDKLKPI